MGCAESKELTAARIVEGLKAALTLAAQETIKQLSAAGGFNSNAALHIPIPGTLGEIMDKVKNLPGLGSKVQEFEDKMNEAAEAAAGACLDIFTAALNGMDFADAKAILEGADNAATHYFREITGKAILEKFVPIVDGKMSELGVVTIYNTITGAYESIPFIGSKVEFNIGEHVCTKAFEGLWTVLAEWEGKVRHTPSMHGTNEALKDCFGAKK